MVNKLVSIIIPVYNAEKTLGKCLSSILNQTYNNLDIIVVNDGSTDNSDNICKKFQNKDKRINYIYQKNSGVSNARNSGINLVKGEYVTFIDADDWIDNDFIESLMNLIVKNNADVITSTAIDFTDDKVINKVDSELKYKIINNSDEMLKELFKGKKYNSVSWGKIYKKEVIINQKFDEDLKIAEDLKFLILVLKNCNKLVATNIRKYHYYINDGSAIHSGFNENWIDAISYYKDIIYKYNDTNLKIYAILNYVSVNLSCYYNFNLNHEEKIYIKSNLKPFSFHILVNKNFNFKLKIKYIFLLLDWRI